MFVSIIIPVYNNRESLELCLSALQQQTYSQQDYEIIVIDNGSQESLESLAVYFPQVKVIYEPNPGSYSARNRGISLAKGRVIAFTDADCVPAKNWLEKGIYHLYHAQNCGLVTGKIELFFQNSKHPTDVELYEKFTAFRQEHNVKAYQFGVTANLFTFKSIFNEVGLFNSSLKSGGDREWGQRVAAAGYSIIYKEDICVKHPARFTIAQMKQKVMRVTEGWYVLNPLQLKFASMQEWLLYLLPSPRIVYQAWKQSDISLKGKVAVVAIMLKVKAWRSWYLFNMILADKATDKQHDLR